MTRRALRHYAALGLLACTATWGPFASAQSQTPVVVMDSTGFDFYSSYVASATQWRGPAFTTGTLPTRITEITFGMQSPALGVNADLRLFQLDDATELPSGAALASATLPIVYVADASNLSPNTYTAAQLGSIPGTTLLANKKYALILSTDAPGGMVLADNDSPPNAYTYAGGFSVAASGYLQTMDSGSTWEQNGSVTPGFRLTVVPFEEIVVPPAAPTPVPSLGTVGLVSLVSVMGLMGLRRSRKSV
ncbi:hypothetical protein GCM10027276_36770 [Comamonas piscis]